VGWDVSRFLLPFHLQNAEAVQRLGRYFDGGWRACPLCFGAERNAAPRLGARRSFPSAGRTGYGLP